MLKFEFRVTSRSSTVLPSAGVGSGLIIQNYICGSEMNKGKQLIEWKVSGVPSGEILFSEMQRGVERGSDMRHEA